MGSGSVFGVDVRRKVRSFWGEERLSANWIRETTDYRTAFRSFALENPCSTLHCQPVRHEETCSCRQICGCCSSSRGQK